MKSSRTKQLSAKELASFCSQLSFIVKAGVPVREGIRIMAEDANDARSRGVLEPVCASLDEGQPLKTALEQSGWFPSYLLHMVDIGETAGRLEEVLDSLSAYYENSDAIGRSIRNAVSYPLVMIAMMAAVIVILVTKVLPIFQQVLAQLGNELSGFSANLLQVGSVLGICAAAVVGLILLIALVLLVMRTFAAGRRALDRFYASCFLTRGVAAKTAAARFASTMSLMLASGLDVDQSLEFTYALIENEPVRSKLKVMQQQIAEGQSFSEALTRAGIFSGLNNRMVTVGFRTGSLDTAMRKIAGRYEQEVDEQISRLISILEPTLVAILSAIVGIIILSVMLPLMSIMSTIS